MADTNPANFANLPKERVQEIASMGGKAAHEKVPLSAPAFTPTFTLTTFTTTSTYPY